MPLIHAADGAHVYFEEAGSGTPLVFVHEFAGDHRIWEPLMRYFSATSRKSAATLASDCGTAPKT